jgi:hypothetical protein
LRRRRLYQAADVFLAWAAALQNPSEKLLLIGRRLSPFCHQAQLRTTPHFSPAETSSSHAMPKSGKLNEARGSQHNAGIVCDCPSEAFDDQSLYRIVYPFVVPVPEKELRRIRESETKLQSESACAPRRSFGPRLAGCFQAALAASVRYHSSAGSLRRTRSGAEGPLGSRFRLSLAVQYRLGTSDLFGSSRSFVAVQSFRVKT